MTSLLLTSHPAAAEDQPYSHEILYFHVLNRFFATGSLLGVFTAVGSSLYSRIRYTTPFVPSFARTSILHAARGSSIGLALGGLATWSRMQGRDEYEWQDRSWRLLENKGQVEQDWWVLGGGAAGSVAAFLAGPRSAAGMVKIAQPQLWPVARVIGGAGLGSAAGMMGFFVVRGGEMGKMKEVVKDEIERGVQSSQAR